MSFDPEKFGQAMGEATAAAIKAALSPVLQQVKALEDRVASIPSTGPAPEPIQLPDIAGMVAEAVKAAVAALPDPAAPLGLASAMIDREGNLHVTFSNGESKNLGRVVGKDGDDGSDGLSLESFDLEYLPESHEVEIKAKAGDRTKSIRYYAGGIRAAGYWRDGKSVKAGEAWSYGGNTWIAIKDGTTETPQAGAKDWYLAARRGKDSETVVRHIKPDQPIKLGA